MRKFGLIGFPLGHSFSKEYFTEKFARENITDSCYENYPIGSIGKICRIISDNPELCGLNVTIPYKTAILRYVDQMDQAVTEVGAANVLKIRKINTKIRITAFNSDITGIKDSLSHYVTANTKKALILGTGGSCRAVAYTLRKMGIEIIKVSRSRSSDALSYNEITPGIIRDTDIIINTTPLGMYPDISSSPAINYDLLNEKHILFDLVYNPELTTFLKMGQERGCRIINGLKMLYSQADKSWEIWNDPQL